MDNEEDIELPNDEIPLDEGKIAVKKVKFDVDVVNIPDGETVENIGLLINHTGEDLVPDEIQPEDSLGKYVKVNDIKISTGSKLRNMDDVVDSVVVGINDVGNNVKPVAYDPSGSEDDYVKIKNIKVATNDLYNKTQFNARYGEGLTNGYNISENEIKIKTLDNLKIDASDYVNKGNNITIFPDDSKYKGKELVGLVQLDMNGINISDSDLEILSNYNIKENCFREGQPIENPFSLPLSQGYKGFKSVSLNLNGLYEDADGNEPNNASVQLVTGREDNKIVSNGNFVFQNYIDENNLYTGWSNFEVEIPILSLSDIKENDPLKKKIDNTNTKIIANGDFNLNSYNERNNTNYAGWNSFVVDIVSNINNVDISQLYPEFQGNVITRSGTFDFNKSGSSNNYTGWNPFTVQIDVDENVYIEKSKLRDGLSINVNDYLTGEGNKEISLMVDGKDFEGVLKPLTINTDGVINKNLLMESYTTQVTPSEIDYSHAFVIDPMNNPTIELDSDIPIPISVEYNNERKFGVYGTFYMYTKDLVDKRKFKRNFVINAENYMENNNSNRQIVINELPGENYDGLIQPIYINTSQLIKKSDLYGYNSEPFVIDYNLLDVNFVMDNDQNVPINIGDKQGIYGPVYINTKNIILMGKNTQPIYKFDNGIVGINNNLSSIINWSNVVNGGIDDGDNLTKGFNLMLPGGKYYQQGQFDISLKSVEIPRMIIYDKNNPSEVLWSPYEKKQGKDYYSFSVQDYDFYRSNSGMDNTNDPFIGFKEIRYRMDNVLLPSRYVNNIEEKNFTLQDYNNPLIYIDQLNGFSGINFKLKNLTINNNFIKSHATYDTNNRQSIIQLLPSEVSDGYRGFNSMILLKMVKQPLLRIDISKKIGLDAYKDKYGIANAKYFSNRLHVSSKLDNDDINNIINDSENAGMEGVDVEVDIPIMDKVVNNVKYTKDGTYTFSIDDWNKLYGLSGSLNNYGNDFCGMNSYTFTIETGSEPPSYSSLYEGNLDGDTLSYTTKDGVFGLILKDQVPILVNSSISVREGEQQYYTGYAPGCFIPLPDLTLENNVTYNEVDYNSGTMIGTEENSWNVSNGIINDGTDIINNSRRLRGLNNRDSFTYPTTGGTLVNNINLLDNYEKTITETFTFDIDDFNRSSENTFGKNFLGVRSFTIIPDITIDNPILESLSIINNGNYYPENGHAYNQVIVNVPNQLTSNYIDSNGMYTFNREQESNIIGWNEINVNVPNQLTSNYIDSNGTYQFNREQGSNVIGWNEITVNVPSSGTVDNATPGNNGIIESNGYYEVPSGKTGWNSFNVNVPTNVGSAVREISGNGYFIFDAMTEINKDGFSWIGLNVNVNSGSSNLENKVIDYYGTWIPTTIEPSSGYDGIRSVVFNNLGGGTEVCDSVISNQDSDVNQLNKDNYTSIVSNEYSVEYSTINNNLWKIFNSSNTDAVCDINNNTNEVNRYLTVSNYSKSWKLSKVRIKYHNQDYDRYKTFTVKVFGGNNSVFNNIYQTTFNRSDNLIENYIVDGYLELNILSNSSMETYDMYRILFENADTYGGNNILSYIQFISCYNQNNNLNEELYINSNGTYYPSNSNSRISKVNVNVYPSLEYKTVNIYENGTSVIHATEGFDGLSGISLNVNVQRSNTDNLIRYFKFKYPSSDGPDKLSDYCSFGSTQDYPKTITNYFQYIDSQNILVVQQTTNPDLNNDGDAVWYNFSIIKNSGTGYQLQSDLGFKTKVWSFNLPNDININSWRNMSFKIYLYDSNYNLIGSTFPTGININLSSNYDVYILNGWGASDLTINTASILNFNTE